MLYKNVDSFISDLVISFFFFLIFKEEVFVLYKKNVVFLINWLGKIVFEKVYK